MATSPVPWSGGIGVDVAILGEAPGRTEDKEGAPFVGSAGNLLRAELKNIGQDPSSFAYVNAVSCYPAGTPSDEEVESCRLNLFGQLAAIRPAYVLSLGVVALKAVSGAGLPYPLKSLHGRPLWVQKVGGTWPVYWGSLTVWPTYHPAAALRSGKYLRHLREDLGEFFAWRQNLTPFPGDCIKCGKEVDWWDDNGIAHCADHAGRQGVLL